MIWPTGTRIGSGHDHVSSVHVTAECVCEGITRDLEIRGRYSANWVRGVTASGCLHITDTSLVRILET